MSTITKDLGVVTAYGYYKAGGGTMTESEFTQFMVDFGTASKTATEAAQEATESAQASAARSADAQDSAEEARQSASTASAKATEATIAAVASIDAKNDAVNAQTAAETAQGKAEDAQAAAAQSASEAAESARTLTIDDTLTQSGQAADAKAVGDAINEVKADLADATGLIQVGWEQGEIVGNTGELNVADTRIRTANVLDARIETLSIESGYEFALCAWNGDTYIGQWNRTNKVWTKGSLYASTSINLSEIRAIYNGYSYKVVVGKLNNASIAVSESNKFSYYPFNEVDLNSKAIETVYTKLSGAEALIDAGYSESGIQGGFVLGDTGNGSMIISSTNNMVTANVQTVTDDCVLATDWSKYKVYVWKVENGAWSGLGWINGDYALSAGFSGRFVVRGVTTHDFTTAEQEEINAVTVYVRSTALKNRVDLIDVGKSDFISICHQGYSNDMSVNQNLLPGFKAAAEHGFDYAETDVALSSNNVVMCCHDSSFVDATTGDTIIIAEHTDAELKTYNYYGGTIATLDEIMLACKVNRIGLVIDHATGALLPYIYPIVSKYGMQDSVIYLIGWAVGNENYAKNMYNSIVAFYKRSKVMFMAGTSSLSEVKTFLSTLDTGFATVYITLNHANYPVADIIALSQELRGDITIAVWTIDNLATAKSYMPYVTAITSNKYSSRDIFA